ncbi:MAG: hypothetical protein EGQ63_08450, partial [Clostridiales bacterium]|nr:hypothetical protein [Clostridiales bacterium]
MQDRNLPISDFELKSPGMLHAPVGAKICEEEFGYTPDMVKAISSHTLGEKDMSTYSLYHIRRITKFFFTNF